MPNKENLKRGQEVMKKYFGDTSPLPPVVGDFMEFTAGNLFGDVWSRPGLDLKTRSRITLTALVVLARWSELQIHLRGAYNLGITIKEIEEMMIHLAHYGGWPCGLSGLREAREAYAKFDKEKKG